MSRHTDTEQDHIQLSQVALEMLCRFHNEGAGEALERMGIDSSLIRRVRRLPVASYHRLLDRLGNFVNLRLDNSILDLQLKAEETRMQQEAQARQLILADAPFPMIEELYGWRRETYQLERRLAGLKHHTMHGRPRLPAEEIAERIAGAWYEVNGSDRSVPQYADQWLELTHCSGASLTEIWFWYRHQRQEITHA
ncbi:MAG: DUF2857 domain-containing protein [Candidatus Thiodiazotropha sp. (ex Lucinoma borealis)]|nr:DUF2857 domain-containing protein [Candidatus Thiodiazotropha sp. (ex Lucinoma borealis)]